MPIFFTGFVCAIVLALGAALSYNFFNITVTDETASKAVHVDQKSFPDKSDAAKEAAEKG